MEIMANESNSVAMPVTLEQNTAATFKLFLTAELPEGKEDIEVKNNAIVRVPNVSETETRGITHVVEKASDEDPEDPDSPNPTVKTYKISGVAWIDENENGLKEETEKLLSDIKVKLLNSKNEIKAEIKTDKNGFYEFKELAKDTYKVMFEYDTDQYKLTKNVTEDVRNGSSAKPQIITENDTEKQVAITDQIEIKDVSISNINIGLIKLLNFDFKIEKLVSKITVQTNKGTKTTQYNKALAKTEIGRREMSRSNGNYRIYH